MSSGPSGARFSASAGGLRYTEKLSATSPQPPNARSSVLSLLSLLLAGMLGIFAVVAVTESARVALVFALFSLAIIGWHTWRAAGAILFVGAVVASVYFLVLNPSEDLSAEQQRLADRAKIRAAATAAAATTSTKSAPSAPLSMPLVLPSETTEAPSAGTITMRGKTIKVRESEETEATQATTLPLVSAPSDSSPAAPSGPIYVEGYYRKDGTYVRPHTRKRR